MSGNTAPLFAAVPACSWTANMTAANTTKDGTSGTTYLVDTAGINGSYIDRLVFRAKGTNVATVARVFINNGSDPTTAANNTLFSDISLAATTNTETAALAPYELYLGFALPAGFRVYITLGTAVAAGWQATALGGDF